jgi:ubiquinone/menaquinone biosynthesis C-methylase UbiE
MSDGKADSSWVKAYYDQPMVVDHYRRATANVGLWRSEAAVFEDCFERGDRILELGTGTGRIAIGLAELGYPYVLGIELSKEMVKEARRIGKVLELSVAFRQGDATRLKFEDNLFDGAIFGFNGLMQIPGQEARLQALREIRRVVKAGGSFVFTTHDRTNAKFRNYWKKEKALWDRGEQKGELIDFGDRWEDTDLGKLYIHVPTPEEMRADLKASGWTVEWDRLRSAIATEPPEVQAFSDECRFWVCR